MHRTNCKLHGRLPDPSLAQQVGDVTIPVQTSQTLWSDLVIVVIPLKRVHGCTIKRLKIPLSFLQKPCWRWIRPTLLVNIVLLHKRSEPLCPPNFRPIVISSTVGMLFCKGPCHWTWDVLPCQWNHWSIHPEWIPSAVNGTVEHIFSLTVIIDHARLNGLPLTHQSEECIQLKITFFSKRHAVPSDSTSQSIALYSAAFTPS